MILCCCHLQSMSPYMFGAMLGAMAPYMFGDMLGAGGGGKGACTGSGGDVLCEDFDPLPPFAFDEACGTFSSEILFLLSVFCCEKPKLQRVCKYFHHQVFGFVYLRTWAN